MWQREQADRCVCGTWPWEYDQDPNVYDAVTTQCLGCLRIARASQDMRHNEGLHVNLARRNHGAPQQPQS